MKFYTYIYFVEKKINNEKKNKGNSHEWMIVSNEGNEWLTKVDFLGKSTRQLIFKIINNWLPHAYFITKKKLITLHYITRHENFDKKKF